MRVVDRISLAALLHDIGKFLQRANVDLERPENWSDYIPNERSYIHALYTYHFFEKYGNFMENLRELPSERPDELSLINLASKHHKPSTPYESIIAVADRLSSSLDREHYDQLKVEEDVRKFRNVRLKPIFEEISLGKHDVSREEFSYPLLPMSPENIFPVPSGETEGSYEELWKGFEEDLSSVPRFKNFNNLFNSLKSLLEKYTWCIPSATIKTVPDVSLFDHLVTTSAIATALFSYHEEAGDLDSCSVSYLEGYGEKEFVFLVGDFSGIQKFIFDRGGTSNKYAAKILRARSFFVSLATEMAAELVVNELSLNASSILSTTAGKFLILAPKLPDLEEKVGKVKDKIRRFLHDRFYGEVNFVIAYLEASKDVFSVSNFSEFMSDLQIKLEEEKLKPIELSQRFVFTDYLEKVKSNEDLCSICGKKPASLVVDQEGDPVCQDCSSFRKIGESLVRDRFVRIGSGLKFSVFGDQGFDFCSKPPRDDYDGLVFQISGDFSGFPLKRFAGYVPRFEEGEWESKKYKDISGDKVDIESREGSIKTFFHIACDALKEEEEKIRGFSALGVLKADVDNLGRIFREGLARKNGNLMTISRYMYLSRMLDSFFTLYVPYAVSKNYPSIYTVFCGGDDLFLIGPYTQVFEFCGDALGSSFRSFVCNNEDITVSAGLILSKPVVPVREMADEAEMALDKSKGREGKNAVTSFGETIGWESFKELMKLADVIEKKRFLLSSHFYKLLVFSEWAGRMKVEPEYARWRAMFRYFVSRNFQGEEVEDMLLMERWIERFKRSMVVPLSLAIYQRRAQ